MLKYICSFMALLLVLSIFSSNQVESRVLYHHFEGIPATQLHQLYAADRRNLRETDQNIEDEVYDHVKRKSDFLLSLYGLPYTLVNKRDTE